MASSHDNKRATEVKRDGIGGAVADVGFRALETFFNIQSAGKQLFALVETFMADRNDSLSNDSLSNRDYQAADITNLFEAAGHHIPSAANGATLTEIKPEYFKDTYFHKQVGLFKNKLEPDSLYDALQALRMYAKRSDHTSSNVFFTDGRAHLIYAITSMVGSVFGLADNRDKIARLNLIKGFVSSVMGSEFARSNHWLRDHQESFFAVLRNLSSQIDSAIVVAESDLNKQATTIAINKIAVGVYGAKELIRTISGILHPNEASPIHHGRPSPQEIKDERSLITCLVDAGGFTLLPLTRPSAVPAEERKTPVSTNNRPGFQSNTKAYMSQIIAWDIAYHKDEKSIPVVDTDSKAAGYPSPFNNYLILPEVDSPQPAVFFAAFKRLMHEKHLTLMSNGSVVLTGRKASFLGSPSLAEVLSIPMGISSSDLNATRDNKSNEEESIAYRARVLKLEINKAQTNIAVSSLLELYASAQELFTTHGEVNGAIFLQMLFPVIQDLLAAAQVKFNEMSIEAHTLGMLNHKMTSSYNKMHHKLKSLSEHFSSMIKTAEQGEQNLTNRVKRIAAEREPLLAEQLRSVHNAINRCADAYAIAGVIEESVATAVKQRGEHRFGMLLPMATRVDAVTTGNARAVIENPQLMSNFAAAEPSQIITERKLGTAQPQRENAISPNPFADSLSPSIAPPVWESKLTTWDSKTSASESKISADQNPEAAVMPGDARVALTEIQLTSQSADIAWEEVGRGARFWAWLWSWLTKTDSVTVADEKVNAELKRVIAAAKQAVILALETGNIQDTQEALDAAIRALTNYSGRYGSDSETRSKYKKEIKSFDLCKNILDNLSKERSQPWRFLSEAKEVKNADSPISFKDFQAKLKNLTDYDKAREQALLEGFKVAENKENEAFVEESCQRSTAHWHELLNDATRNPLLAEITALSQSVSGYQPFRGDFDLDKLRGKHAQLKAKTEVLLALYDNNIIVHTFCEKAGKHLNEIEAELNRIGHHQTSLLVAAARTETRTEAKAQPLDVERYPAGVSSLQANSNSPSTDSYPSDSGVNQLFIYLSSKIFSSSVFPAAPQGMFDLLESKESSYEAQDQGTFKQQVHQILNNLRSINPITQEIFSAQIARATAAIITQNPRMRSYTARKLAAIQVFCAACLTDKRKGQGVTNMANVFQHYKSFLREDLVLETTKANTANTQNNPYYNYGWGLMSGNAGNYGEIVNSDLFLPSSNLLSASPSNNSSSPYSRNNELTRAEMKRIGEGSKIWSSEELATHYFSHITQQYLAVDLGLKPTNGFHSFLNHFQVTLSSSSSFLAIFNHFSNSSKPRVSNHTAFSDRITECLQAPNLSAAINQLVSGPSDENIHRRRKVVAAILMAAELLKESPISEERLKQIFIFSFKDWENNKRGYKRANSLSHSDAAGGGRYWAYMEAMKNKALTPQLSPDEVKHSNANPFADS